MEGSILNLDASAEIFREIRALLDIDSEIKRLADEFRRVFRDLFVFIIVIIMRDDVNCKVTHAKAIRRNYGAGGGIRHEVG
jgi:hypothetical protein